MEVAGHENSGLHTIWYHSQYKKNAFKTHTPNMPKFNKLVRDDQISQIFVPWVVKEIMLLLIIDINFVQVEGCFLIFYIGLSPVVIFVK